MANGLQEDCIALTLEGCATGLSVDWYHLNLLKRSSSVRLLVARREERQLYSQANCWYGLAL